MYFKTSKFFLYLVPLGVAIVTTSTLFPFIVGKYSWFRANVDLALIFFLLGLVFNPRESAQIGIDWRLKKIFSRPLVIAVTAFTAIFLLASFFGVDPANSFWSNFERGEGGLQILHFWIFFMLLNLLFKEEADWRRLFAFVLAGGVLMALYGIFAGFGFENFIGPRFGDPGLRFSGSIGNPAYTAAYAIFMIFYAAYLLASKYKSRLFSGGALVLWGLIILFFAVFLAAATRGAFLGFAAAVVAFALYLGFTNRRLRLWIFSGAFIFLLVIVLLIIFRDVPFIKSLPFSRIFDISAHATTFRHRAIMWGIALQAFKERPILGWGPENYLYAFDSRFDTAYFNPPEQFGAWFDRAHSIYFDYLAETGIFGLLAYLSIFAAFYWQLFKKTRILTPHEQVGADKKSKLAGQNERESAVVKALLFAAPVAYLVQGMVLFDVWPIYLNVFILIAFGNYKLQIPSTKLQANSNE